MLVPGLHQLRGSTGGRRGAPPACGLCDSQPSANALRVDKLAQDPLRGAGAPSTTRYKHFTAPPDDPHAE